jgi:Dynein light chain type 1
MSDRKAVIKNADMAEEMQQDAVDCATQALEKFNIEKVRYIIIFLLSCTEPLPDKLLASYKMHVVAPSIN